MSNFVVSARKYRPQRFEDVVGQQHVAGTLKNALATDHVAHAFLFTGPRGVGKTTCARILAKTVTELQASDIVNHALDPLATSAIRDIHILGRRGPYQASFTLKEVGELGELSRATPRVDPGAFPPADADERDGCPDAPIQFRVLISRPVVANLDHVDSRQSAC